MLHISNPNSETDNDEAASASGPSRATKTTSTANTAICSKFAPTIGAASRSMARSSSAWRRGGFSNIGAAA